MSISWWKLAGVLVVCLLFSFVPSAAAQSCASQPAGMVVWWPGNGNAKDIVGSNTGSLQNGATFVSGKVGQAFSFDGIDDFVQIPNSSDLQIAGAVTIDAWIYLRGGTFYPSIVSKGNVGNYLESYDLFTGAWNNQVAFLLNRDGTSGGRTILWGPTIPYNTWAHLAATYDGTTMRLYINGALVGSAAHSGGIHVTADPVLIGKADRTSSPSPYLDSYLKGDVDEVEIFNRALSLGEIQAIFNAGSAGKCTPPVANAGADQTVSCASAAGAEVTLNGSGTDVEGETLAYEWKDENGNVVGDTSSVALTVPLGAHTFTLTVTDDMGSTASDDVQINVNVGVTGLLPPLSALVEEGFTPVPPKAFKLGSTLPLKLVLYCGSTILAPANVLPPELVGLTRGGDEIELSTIDPDSGEANDNGLLFRYAEPNWVFNFSTKNAQLATGTYIIAIKLPDGRTLFASFVLR